MWRALPGETGARFDQACFSSPPVRCPSCNRAGGIPPPVIGINSKWKDDTVVKDVSNLVTIWYMDDAQCARPGARLHGHPIWRQ